MNRNWLNILLVILFMIVAEASLLFAETYQRANTDGSIYPPSSDKQPNVQQGNTDVTPSLRMKKSKRTVSTGNRQTSQEQVLEPLVSPDTSNPAVAAFVAWHIALINGDFASYRDLTPAMPNIANNLQRQLFDQIRLNAPRSIKITAPELNERGTIELTSVGCNGNRPVVSVAYVRKIDGAWRVAGSGWGPSWNPKISEIVKCP